MSRKTALHLDADPTESAARVASKSRVRRRSSDSQLVGEVIAIAFDHCEAVVDQGVCGTRPVALCTGCGTARCRDHGIGGADDRHCSTCSAALLTLASAPFEDVLDTRLRLKTVPRW